MKYSATVPVIEPITVDDAKTHLRTLPGDTSEDSAIIAPLITAAREYCENVTGRALVTQTIKAYPTRLEPLMRLPRPPISSVSSVRYTDAAGAVATMDAAAYAADDENIVFYQIPQFVPSPLNPIEIAYTAGYATLPFSIRQAMLLLIGHWYNNREAVVVGPVTSVEVQVAVERLLNQWKVWWY